MWSPLFVILLVYELQFISHSLTLKFPVVFADDTYNNLLIFVHNCISADLLTIIHLIFFSHFDLVKHFIIIIDFLISLVRLLLFHLLDVFIFRLFKIEIFSFQGFSSKLIQNWNYLFSTSWLEFQGWELTGYTELFAFVDYVGRYCHGIIEFGKIRARNIIKLEKPFYQTKIGNKFTF